jgi:hypothetical protein
VSKRGRRNEMIWDFLIIGDNLKKTVLQNSTSWEFNRMNRMDGVSVESKSSGPEDLLTSQSVETVKIE